LFEHSLAVAEGLGEVFLEICDFVVDVGVFWDESGFVEFDQGGFGSEVDHGIGVGHSDESCGRKFSQSFKINFLVVWEGAGVDSADIASESMGDVMVDLLSFVIFKFDHFAVPALGFDGINNGYRILSVAIRSFVTASD
jgi:hypothetical protein